MIDSEFIVGGEGPRLAFVDSANTVQIAENMVAFANTEGGVIVVGVQSDGNSGAAPPEVSEIDRVLKLADDLYNPPVVTEKLEQIHFQTIEDRPDPPSNLEATGRIQLKNAARKLPAYAIRVPRSTELHALSDGRVLIRSGKVNRPLGGQEILRLASAKNTGDFEGEAVPGATVDDFSREMIDEYLEKRAERTKRPYDGEINNLLAEVGAITADGKPTVCGLLLFSEYPQKWLPQSGVVFAKFVGTTPRGDSGLAGYTRREELTGPVPRLIEATWNLVWSEMAVSAVVKGLEREETFEYPQFAVREALVNAMCHRDYRLRGRRIEVRMFSDRLEVISPGGLPGFITVENIKDEHFSRNPRLVGGLFQWGYIEELGLGIDRMIEVMEQAGHSPPKFDARPYSFALALHNERKKPKPPEWSRDTNHRQARALQYIRENGSITNREFRGLINAVSAETLRLDLVDMVDKGILTKIGAKKGTYYVLREKR
ncbi:MAG: putative DNA binding domain-containing protein [Chloroflexi bacterium]|nr:putative DNA binding domain-containing protein [Chloroflexota bacterium]